MSKNAHKITENIYWVGALDPNLRNFHGYNTSRGTTYNAYLIMGKEPILVDTVKAPFYEEMMERITSVVDPSKIKYIISNHSELDHTGALPQTIELIKPDKIFASKNGALALKDHFHWEQEITVIKDGEKVTLGDSEVQFFESKMLHWPDSMFTFLPKEKILFSQDVFGMHFACNKLFVDENDSEIIDYEATKYFANILLPYTNFVGKICPGICATDLEMIAPDHGPIWKGQKNCHEICNRYQDWSEQKRYKKAVIIYDTMWESTAKMANAISEGLKEQNIETKLLCLNEAHRSDVATEILEAGALLIGSPILNNQLFPTVVDSITYLKGLKRKNLVGQYFGSYGWSAKPFDHLKQHLNEMGIEQVAEPVLSKYVPNNEILDKCRALGASIANKLDS